MDVDEQPKSLETENVHQIEVEAAAEDAVRPALETVVEIKDSVHEMDHDEFVDEDDEKQKVVDGKFGGETHRKKKKRNKGSNKITTTNAAEKIDEITDSGIEVGRGGVDSEIGSVRLQSVGILHLST